MSSFLHGCIYKLICASSKIGDVALLHFQYNNIEYGFPLLHSKTVTSFKHIFQPCKNGFVRICDPRYLTSSFYIFNQVYTIHGDKNRSTMIIVCISGHVIHRMSRSNGNLAFKGLENIRCKLIFLYFTYIENII